MFKAWIPVVLLVGACILIVSLLMAGCGALIGDESGKRLLEKQGFEDVRTVDKDVWFVWSCGQDDLVLFTYEAKNVRGDTVEVQVCDGILKGATIRE